MASPSVPVHLTLVTCYASSPITAISDLWVGSCGDNLGMGENILAAGKGRLRIAVSGRSGSSRMSVWDLTQTRQLLEVRRLVRM